MQDVLPAVQELQEQAKSARKKGDALRKAGRDDAARDAYRAGVRSLTAALEKLDATRRQLLAAEPPLDDGQEAALNELVETFGSLGGMQQRLGLLQEALRSYSDGAILEQRFQLSSTYNRLNEVKYALLTGQSTLQDQQPRIEGLAHLIEEHLRADKIPSDSGWALADLGDCMALLGRIDEARHAYSEYISKAEIKSSERTLDVLRELAFHLQASSDPDAPRLQAAIDALQSSLAAQ